jgi:integrase
MPRRLVKPYCEAAGIDPRRLGSRDIGIHSLRKSAINDAFRNGTTVQYDRQIANHASPRTTRLYGRFGDEITLTEVERIVI